MGLRSWWRSLGEGGIRLGRTEDYVLMVEKERDRALFQRDVYAEVLEKLSPGTKEQVDRAIAAVLEAER